MQGIKVLELQDIGEIVHKPDRWCWFVPIISHSKNFLGIT